MNIKTANLFVLAVLLLGGHALALRGGPAQELRRGGVDGQEYRKLYRKSRLNAVYSIVNYPPEILKG